MTASGPRPTAPGSAIEFNPSNAQPDAVTATHEAAATMRRIERRFVMTAVSLPVLRVVGVPVPLPPAAAGPAGCWLLGPGPVPRRRDRRPAVWVPRGTARETGPRASRWVRRHPARA